ncbi:Uma2 family endonuclease [Argonema galeatum]|uniref:Uma2 family endonuclease n=1 Tax=Argonema galeatum TaxID=2942762 RepID=UPI002013B70C|nr:Uma2 family endonuclease [Argonema galeatum]MCL1462948.1 Uma2 family endonuclease [Argonema galeatum A003/A1]
MTISYSQLPTQIEYPDEDGKPMAESDQARNYLTYAVEVLRIYFQNRTDVYVSGNLFIYYEEGNPSSVISPDAFVVFGVEKRERRSYKTWEEEDKNPDFVLEITSKSTRSQDQGAKKGIYAFLGVGEYFQYDPTGDYLNPRLQGLHLVEGNYLPCSATVLPDGTTSISSEVLGLELRLLPSGEWRFYDPVAGKTLLTHQEEVAARQAAEARIAELEARLRALEDR